MRHNTKKIDAIIIAVLFLTVLGIILKVYLSSDSDNSSDSGDMLQKEVNDVKYTDYIGKNIGILTGSSFEDPTLEIFPNSNYLYFDSLSDLILALKQGKIDCFIEDEPVLKIGFVDYPELSYLPEILREDVYSFVFAKDSDKHKKLLDQFNEMLSELNSSGELEKIKNKWFSDGFEKIKIDKSGLTGENGKLLIACNPLNTPFCMIVNNELEGYGIELTYIFCRKYGYQCEIEQTNVNSALAGISAGKYDICANSCTVTEDRKQSMNFSEPIYYGGISLAVRTSDLGDLSYNNTDKKDFLESLKESFDKNFIKEDRWQLIVEGIGTTCLITILTTVFGTILAFLICIFRRTGSKLANSISNIYVKLLQGTPMVVLLMILYYIIFGNSSIDAKWVAVIGFSLNLGAYGSEIMKSGIESIDGGQREAALALGYSENKAFFKFIFPQAAVRFLPVYRGELVSLLKSTSIVGYIAIQDLTKMSDIIRSRTYEAFFPLITTAIIYFILAWFISIGMNYILTGTDPFRRRKRKLKESKKGGERN